jgi:hypothetical protein
LIYTNVTEEATASIFRVKVQTVWDKTVYDTGNKCIGLGLRAKQGRGAKWAGEGVELTQNTAQGMF